MQKLILILCLVSLTATGAEVVSAGRSSGSGPSKAEAYANAIGRIPGNANPTGTFYNGHSSKCGDKVLYGRYTCTITWKKYSNK